MTISVRVAIEGVRRESSEQISLDFQALRLQSPDIDSVYDDWVMTEEHFRNLGSVMQDASGDLYHALHNYIGYMSVGREMISIDIKVGRCSIDINSVTDAIHRYYKSRVLAWWYQMRNAEMAKAYTLKADGILEQIYNLCITRIGTLTPRYF